MIKGKHKHPFALKLNCGLEAKYNENENGYYEIKDGEKIIKCIIYMGYDIELREICGKEFKKLEHKYQLAKSEMEDLLHAHKVRKKIK
jgi:hypothetical protein